MGGASTEEEASSNRSNRFVWAADGSGGWGMGLVAVWKVGWVWCCWRCGLSSMSAIRLERGVAPVVVGGGFPPEVVMGAGPGDEKSTSYNYKI